MKENYNDILNVQIGLAELETTVSDSFPVVGKQIAIDAKMKWSQRVEFTVVPSIGTSNTDTIDPVTASQSAGKVITVTGAGDLEQTVKAINSVSAKVVKKTLYAMTAKNEPYFDIALTKEIIRTDGEKTQLIITAENGYNPSVRRYKATMRIYKENTEEPVYTSSEFTYLSGGVVDGIEVHNLMSLEFSISEREIYDIEVDLKDIELGLTFTKRINKYLSVTPTLSPRPSANTPYTEINTIYAWTSYAGKKQFKSKIYDVGNGRYYAELIQPRGEADTGYYDAMDLSVFPAGTTLVLKADPEEPTGYYRRLLVKGHNLTSISSQSGTPQFTWDMPLIITIDQDAVYDWPFIFYSGVNFNDNIRHVVFDGRGYYNLSKGIHIHKYLEEDVFGEDCMMLLNGTSDIELFELEMSNADFTAIMSKTDPDPNRPWYWYGNFVENRFCLHHCYVHDTAGEGFYLGYFDTGFQTKTNNAGQSVTFRPHLLTNARIYRNDFRRLGYDGMQLSNAWDSEVCYNTIIEGGTRNEADQSSGISIQGIKGKIYNNYISEFSGPGLQCGPIGDVEIFNNIISGTRDGSGAIQFLWSYKDPYHDPNNDGINTTINIVIHNNILYGRYVCINARNTVQFHNVYVYDNLMVYKGNFFGNMTEATKDIWISQMRGNEIIDINDLETKATELKIADYINGNWRVAGDSTLISTGNGRYFNFSYNGYKGWYPNVFPIGSFQGSFRDPNQYVIPLKLLSFLINNGEITTALPVVSIALDYEGKAIKYRIGLTEDLSGEAWKNLAEVMTYVLPVDYGNKRIYVQVAGIIEESNVMFADINYLYMPSVLTAVKINNGEEKTIFDKVSVTLETALQVPEFYKISEDPAFSDLLWVPYKNSLVEYTFTGSSSVRTIYAKVMRDNTESLIRSSSIQYVNTIGYDDVSLSIPVSELGITSADEVEIEIPTLKYNKKFAYTYTFDDDITQAYGKVFCSINKRWVDDEKFFHVGQAKTTGIIPAKTLGYTDGCGKEKRFTFGVAVWPNSGNASIDFFMHPTGKKIDKYYPYLVWDDLVPLVDFGNDLCFHNVNERVYDMTNTESILDGLKLDQETANSRLGYKMSTMARPDGNNVYVTAGRSYDDIYFMVTENAIDDGSAPLEINLKSDIELYKKVQFRRYTEPISNADILMEKIAAAAISTGCKWVHDFGHGPTNFQYVLDLLLNINNTYGKDGDDSVWFASVDEIFEYAFLRKHSVINKRIENGNLIIDIRVAKLPLFKKKEFTVLVKSKELNTTPVVTPVSPVYGLSYAKSMYGLMVNVNYNSKLDLMAEKYVSILEEKETVEAKEDAEYFVSNLLPSLRVPYLDRINSLTSAPVLSSLIINNEDGTTDANIVTCRITYLGKPSHYRIGLSDVTLSDWTEFLSDDITFSLPKIANDYTIYCRLKNQYGESDIVSDSIKYVPAAFGLSSILINGGDETTTNKTVSVLFMPAGIQDPTHVMLSESSDFANSVWLTYLNPISFRFSSYGICSIYAKIKSGEEVSEVKQDSIEITELPKRKAILSLAYTAWADYKFVPERKVTQIDGFGNERDFFDTEGIKFGSIIPTYNTNTSTDRLAMNLAANITESNSGIYSDEDLSRCAGWNSNNIALKCRTRLNGLLNGTYKVSLLCNTKPNKNTLVEMARYSIGDVMKTPTKIVDNFDTLLVFDNVEAADGTIDIYYWGESAWNTVPINVIEIEEQ